MDNEERIIKITGSGWSAKFSKDKNPGSLKLTNKRLTFGASGKTILLEDIENVEIETRTADVTRIKIRFGRETEYIDFARHTARARRGAEALQTLERWALPLQAPTSLGRLGKGVTR